MAAYVFTKQAEGFTLSVDGGPAIGFVNHIITYSTSGATLAFRIGDQVYHFVPEIDSITVNGAVFSGSPAALWALLTTSILNEQVISGPAIFGEIPSGPVNGSNATFITEFSFIPESAIVFVNGLLQNKIIHFNTTGTQTILLNESPQADDIVTVLYIKQ